MGEFLTFFVPALAGVGFWWLSGKCRGRNARTAFRFAAWGAWLYYLIFLPIGLPLLPGFLNTILRLSPSVLCFLLAASFVLKEMRAQQRGDYTDVA